MLLYEESYLQNLEFHPSLRRADACHGQVVAALPPSTCQSRADFVLYFSCRGGKPGNVLLFYPGHEASPLTALMRGTL